MDENKILDYLKELDLMNPKESPHTLMICADGSGGVKNWNDYSEPIISFSNIGELNEIFKDK